MRGIWKKWLISFFKRKEQNIFKFVRDAPMSWHIHFDMTCFDELRHWKLERGFEKRLELIPGCWLRLFFCCQQILQIEKEFIKIQSLEIVVSNVWTQMVWKKNGPNKPGWELVPFWQNHSAWLLSASSLPLLTIRTHRQWDRQVGGQSGEWRKKNRKRNL